MFSLQPINNTHTPFSSLTYSANYLFLFNGIVFRGKPRNTRGVKSYYVPAFLLKYVPVLVMKYVPVFVLK